MGARRAIIAEPSSPTSLAQSSFFAPTFFSGFLRGLTLSLLSASCAARPPNHFLEKLGRERGQPRQHKGEIAIVIGDVEKLWFGFQHHVAHFHGRDAEGHRLLLVMHLGEELAVQEHGGLVEPQHFFRAGISQSNLPAFFPSYRHRAAPDWGFDSVRYSPACVTNAPPRSARN